MFAWFDPFAIAPQQQPAEELWAEPLSRYWETDDANQARQLLTFAENEAKRLDPQADRPQPLWVFTLDYECAPWFDSAFSSAFRHRRPGKLRLWHFAHSQRLSADAAQARAQARLSDPIAGFLDWRCNWQEEDFAAAVAKIHRYLQEGDAYQVNLTFAWHARYFGSLLALYLRLRAAQPVPYGAFLPLPDGGAILCRSPELFFARERDLLICRPMKGTAPHGVHNWLDGKTAAENVMIVDLIRNDLGRLAPPGGVRVSSLFTVEPYATLQQLTSTIEAQPVDASLWELLTALFPCGSVTGAPKRRALEIISELETTPRGIYCGALGLILPGADLRVAVPIRTLTAAADRSVTLGVGSGIVIESQAADEWQECQLKSRFARALPCPVGLIETLRWQKGEGIALWPFHKGRLAASAAALGIPYDEQRIYQAIYQAIGSLPQSNALRIRLLLTPDGTANASASPYQPPAFLPVPFLVSDALVIDETNPLQRHKTTHRAAYDALLAEAAAQGLFDLIVCNRRGELVEGCRSTLFLRFPGDPLLYTPPLASGCLAGVLRALLLTSGKAVEHPLFPADLTRAEAIFLGNALHGLLPARLRT